MHSLRLALLCLVAACGAKDDDGLDPADQVISLDDDQLTALCQEFHTTICAGNSAQPECQPGCCDKAEIPATMRQECIAPITIDDVRDCAAAFAAQAPDAMTICAERMGGCVFDVFDAQCSSGS